MLGTLKCWQWLSAPEAGGRDLWALPPGGRLQTASALHSSQSPGHKHNIELETGKRKPTKKPCENSISHFFSLNLYITSTFIYCMLYITLFSLYLHTVYTHCGAARTFTHMWLCKQLMSDLIWDVNFTNEWLIFFILFKKYILFNHNCHEDNLWNLQFHSKYFCLIVIIIGTKSEEQIHFKYGANSVNSNIKKMSANKWR